MRGTSFTRKIAALAVSASLACCLGIALSGCAGGEAEAPEAAEPEATEVVEAEPAEEAPETGADATREFTDSCGRTVEIPTEITAIGASGSMAQQVIFTLAPEKLVGLSDELRPAELKYLGDEYADLPVFGQIYGGKGSFNKEAIAAANPQLIVDIGEAKDSIVSDLDELQSQIGIPCVHIEATLETWDEAYAMLGELLGCEDKAAELGAYCSDAVATTKAAMDQVPADQRAKGVFLMGDAGLNVLSQGAYQASVFELCVDNLAVVEGAKGKGTGEEISMETLALWNPDLILFGPNSVYASVGDDATWQTLSAIANGNYYQIPGEPYNWMTQPASVNQIMGVQWLPRLLYPELFDDSIRDVVDSYYKLFYGFDMDDATYEELMVGAL